MQVELVDHMGSDLSVANAARVSFGKRKTIMDKSDEKLISYLAKHNHWTPFGHTTLSFHIKAPMFVARQLGKHQVGLVWNEISRRYVDNEPEFYNPPNWRLRAENVKQGSSNETVEYDITEYNKSCLNMYNELLSKNIAPEMARMVLPQNIMTEWWWSGSLAAFSRICKLRLAKDAQMETRIIAQMISDECEKLFPVSWVALKNGFENAE
jgi:thymidylate synthase (FAD)